ncbi:hypothetical protein [Arthrobacter sp. SO3]|uniref:hypothetical protein n=1 Tax=Arthrobacter sp. SO3 TaxID=1897057 RepID=UPI001CFF95AE|nr:hypothetical protein [Arthrobacter sp. SO3]
MLSTGAITLVALLPGDEFMAWGWRLPFIASIVLVAVALWAPLERAGDAGVSGAQSQ